MEIIVPGWGKYIIKHLVLDLNGTIALDGEIIEGVAERLYRLSQSLNISIVTADTKGNAERLIKNLPVKLYKIDAGDENGQKLGLVQKMGKDKTISIGNGSNDVLMLKESLIGICILGREGASIEAIVASDLIVSNINDAFDLLLKPDRLKATLRR